MNWRTLLKNGWNAWRKKKVEQITGKVFEKVAKVNVITLTFQIQSYDSEQALRDLITQMNMNFLERTEGGNWKAKTTDGKSAVITVLDPL